MPEHPDAPISLPLDAWLTRLGQPNGEPGGGAASGVMLGIAAALLGMVAGYSTDDPRAADAAERLSELRQAALDAAEDDGARSAGLGAALRVDAADPARHERVREAAIAASASSVRLGEVGARLLSEARLLAEIGDRHLVADLAVASGGLAAGLSGALINLRANLPLARRHGASSPALDALETTASALADAARDASALLAKVSQTIG